MVKLCLALVFLHFALYLALEFMQVGSGAVVVLATIINTLIIVLCRDMIWKARRRGDKEIQQFQLVNRGLKEPHPSFLVETWR